MKALSGRPKKCKACCAKFMPSKPLQVACSVKCAITLVTAQKEKDRRAQDKIERLAHREAKAKIKTKAEHMKEAQASFNAWVRMRDAMLPCVSCGRHHDGQYHAGHYRSVGSCPELRFEPLNVWKQCAPCNNHLSGNAIEYRIELARRIGAEKVEWLEGKHEPKRYTIEDLQAIKANYRKLARELEKANA